MLNSYEYEGDDRYREFLGGIMNSDGRSQHHSGVLSSRHGNAVSRIVVRLSEMTKPVVAGMAGRIDPFDLEPAWDLKK